MTNARMSQTDRLMRMQLFLDGIRDHAELRTAVAKVGIDEALLAEGDKVYEAAKQAVDTQDALESQLSETREQLNAAREDAWSIYMVYVQVASLRITKSTRLRELLELDAERETGVNERYEQMRRFYDRATDPEAEAALTRYGIWEEDLELGRAAVARVRALDVDEARINGEKKFATQAQHVALDAMDAWYAARFEEATFATRHKPQLMESLGKTVK